MQAARFSSIRTVSTSTSMLSPSNFMTTLMTCFWTRDDTGCVWKCRQLKRTGKEKKESTKVYPYEAEEHSVSGQTSFTVLSPHISNIYAKKKGIAKKLILTLRAIMISQEVEFAAGDFNGTAWRCRSRDNFSTIDEVLMDSILLCLRHWSSTIVVTWIHSRQLGRRLRISQTTWLSTFLENQHGALSIPRKTLGLRPSDHSCHHETWSNSNHRSVVRPCRTAVSTEDMPTSTAFPWAALKYHSLQLLREYHFITCLTMPIIGSSEG